MSALTSVRYDPNSRMFCQVDVLPTQIRDRRLYKVVPSPLIG